MFLSKKSSFILVARPLQKHTVLRLSLPSLHANESTQGVASSIAQAFPMLRNVPWPRPT